MQAHKKKLIIDVYLHLMPLQRSNVAGRLKPFGQKKGHLHTSTI
jgi:hypothetical protein